MGLAFRTSAMSWTADNLMDTTGKSNRNVSDRACVCEMTAALEGDY